MSKLFAALSAAFVYFCVGQTLILFILVGAFVAKGHLTHDVLLQISAVVQGVDLRELQAAADAARAKERQPQPSLDEVAEARALKARDLELREQELRNQLNLIRQEQSKLVAEADRYQRVQNDFEQRLKMLREGAIATNLENARLILENMKAKQAKEQIQLMLEAGEMKQAVALLSNMPIEKRAKIITEFKTDSDSEQLAEMLRLIRQGEPEVTLIDETNENLNRSGT
jgi:flagellar motility protein MotE (MotC chaperone)